MIAVGAPNRGLGMGNKVNINICATAMYSYSGDSL